MKSAGILVLIVVLAGCGGRTSPVSPVFDATQHTRPTTLRVSQGIMDGLKIRHVRPVYPQGGTQEPADVIVWFLIDSHGSVTKVTATEGDPMLAKAATEAVMQWKYQPYILDGEPIEVETKAVVSFGK